MGADSSRVARVIAAALSLVITTLSITLMARHRQAEITDAEWLEDYESTVVGSTMPVHGVSFRRTRNGQSLDAGPIGGLIPLLPGFKTWVIGLAVFGLAAVLVLVLAISAPSVLA